MDLLWMGFMNQVGETTLPECVFGCFSSQHLWAMELSATEQTSTAWFSWGYSIIFHVYPYTMLAQGYTILIYIIYIVLWCFIPMLGTGTLSESLKTSWASFSVGRRQGVSLKLRVASKMLRSALKCLARTKPLSGWWFGTFFMTFHI